MAGPVFVHMGLAKTGTTTLQQDVFSRTPAIAYLGKNLVPEPLDEMRRRITRAGDDRFDAAEARAAFDHYREGLPGVAIFSDEDLSVWKFLDPAVMGARIGEVFRDNRPIYVTRRPRDWVVSQYFFRLATWRPDTMAGINPWLESHIAALEVGSDVAEIRFAETFRRFWRAAGEKPCLILPYELMAADIDAFLAAIEGFMGLDRQLRALAPAPGAPRKVRIGRRMADFHRSLDLLERDRPRFIELARLMAGHAVVADRRRFEILAADPAASADDWQVWLAVIERRVGNALAGGDAALGEALELNDDYAIRPDLLARIDAIAAGEVEAMKRDFGVDLGAWDYAGAG